MSVWHNVGTIAVQRAADVRVASSTIYTFLLTVSMYNDIILVSTQWYIPSEHQGLTGFFRGTPRFS